MVVGFISIICEDEGAFPFLSLPLDATYSSHVPRCVGDPSAAMPTISAATAQLLGSPGTWELGRACRGWAARSGCLPLQGKGGGRAQKATLFSGKGRARARKSPMNAANNHNSNIYTALTRRGTVQSGLHGLLIQVILTTTLGRALLLSPFYRRGTEMRINLPKITQLFNWHS